MNFLTLLLPVFNTLIDKIFTSKSDRDQAMLEMQRALNEANQELYKAQAVENEAKKEIITTEISQGSWASNWRAYLMMVCISIVAYNWIIVSLFNAVLSPLGCPIMAVPVPPELWTLVTVGLGGYIGKETISTYSHNKYGPTNDKKFFDVLRSKIFKSGMTQEQVDALEQALKARDGE